MVSDVVCASVESDDSLKGLIHSFDVWHKAKILSKALAEVCIFTTFVCFIQAGQDFIPAFETGCAVILDKRMQIVGHGTETR